MNGTLIGILILVVALIVGPFATLRAVSYYRDRRSSPAEKTPAPAEDGNPDDKSSDW